jgi:SAM-dependent methyltransferase
VQEVVSAPDAGRDLCADSVGWDVATWSRAMPYWLSRTRLASGARALELGAGGENGGLSLWLAARGCQVTCSGLEPPTDSARELHRRYRADGRIRYAVDDVLTMQYEQEFDLVVFKSVLGRVGAGGDFGRQRRAVARMHQALRPGGELWFAENASASGLHRMGRRHFGAGRWQWRYISLDEVPVLLSSFEDKHWRTFGTSAAFGRSERQRAALARVDAAVLDRALPASWHYVVAAHARRASHQVG